MTLDFEATFDAGANERHDIACVDDDLDAFLDISTVTLWASDTNTTGNAIDDDGARSSDLSGVTALEATF